MDILLEITKLEQKHRALQMLPFPRSIYEYQAAYVARDKPVMLAFTYADGCLSSFLQDGKLPAEKIRSLEASAEVFSECLDIEDTEGKTYIERELELCLAVLKLCQTDIP